MLANLHLIKLFIWHSLRNDPRIQQHGTLPKLEAKCLKAAFNEIRDEGFADDGLFPKLEEFFYPLTISEYEIRRKRQMGSNEHRIYLKQRDQLRLDIKELTNQVDEQVAMFWDSEYKCDLLREKFHRGQNDYLRERENIQSRFNNRQQHLTAEALQRLDQQWQKKQSTLNGQLKDLNQKQKELSKKKSELEKQLEEYEKNLKNIETELAHPRKNIDEKLVKPARGLIMYGPPGTGKSEIMSQVAKKLGVLMVSEPLAAGELNRPYVGESERILVALCTRCHRVPYAMCCISIDEIDSLAPKRDEDSSEGKVDKISVLLSLIEGIKDVPNLMILCATNRLHMMDEAFLRRMSGKFFVGRPSSNARLSMLKKIPEWALKLELINLLTRATTNFSGAAVK
jgi:SpoVK/Ycf46/Vps4 family AAA+-type ATPase